MPPSPLPLLLTLLLVTLSRGELSMLGPAMAEEPPPRVQYTTRTGVRVRCAARGQPTPLVSWLADDGTALHDQPGLRRIHSNGTLEMLPSSAYETAATTVRCRAANVHGVALSRDVTLVPVSEAGWEVAAQAGAAAAGGVAAVTCAATRDAALVRPALWYRGDTVLHIDPPSPESRYLVAGSTLLILGVGASDAGAYSCLARHALTAATKRARPVTLTVTAASSSTAPRLVAAGGELSVAAGQPVCLPCVASDHPAPQYT